MRRAKTTLSLTERLSKAFYAQPRFLCAPEFETLFFSRFFVPGSRTCSSFLPTRPPFPLLSLRLLSLDSALASAHSRTAGPPELAALPLFAFSLFSTQSLLEGCSSAWATRRARQSSAGASTSPDTSGEQLRRFFPQRRRLTRFR